MSNNLMNEIMYVDFKNKNSIQLKQADSSPIVIKLVEKTSINSLTSLRDLASQPQEKATVYLMNDKNTVIFKELFDVKLGTISLVINKALPVGKYYLEILYKGRKYPSNNSFLIQINPSADIADEELVDLETIDAIENNIITKVVPKVQEQLAEIVKTGVSDYLTTHTEDFKGERGEPGAPGVQGKSFTFEDFTEEQLQQLKGDKGEPGNISDTEDWQKYKLTLDDGTYKVIDTINFDSPEEQMGNGGNAFVLNPEDAPLGFNEGFIKYEKHETNDNIGVSYERLKYRPASSSATFERIKVAGIWKEWKMVSNNQIDSNWIPIVLHDGFFNSDESENNLAYRLVNNGTVGYLTINGVIRTPNKISVGKQNIGNIAKKNSKPFVLNAHASNYSGSKPEFSIVYEDKMITINALTEIPANTIIHISGTTICDLLDN